MIRSILAVGLLTFAASANAQGFSYDYLQVNVGKVEFDGTDADGDALGLSGSFAVNENWHMFAGYEGIGLDFGVDASTIGFGVGYNTELTPSLDAYARLSYQRFDIDVGGGNSDFDTDGLGFGIGVRYAAAERVELNVGLNYVNVDDGGDDLGVSGGALYDITDVFALGIGAGFSDDSTSYSLVGRFYFR